MNVIAVSVPLRAGWRWRIVDHAGAIVAESEETFATIGQAVAEGARRRRRMNAPEGVTRPPASVSLRIRKPGAA